MPLFHPFLFYRAMLVRSLQLAMRLFHPLLFGLSLHSSRTSANCYFPNGTDVNYFNSPDVYKPCNEGDDNSMCCRLGDLTDKCRRDGLCLSTWDSNLWRESCTDRTWKSPICIKLCTQGTGFYSQGSDPLNLSNVDFTVTQCGDGSYCCGSGTIGKGCCDDRKGVFLLNGYTVSYNPFPTTSTTTSSPSATTSLSSPSLPGATSSSSSSPDKSSSARTTAIIVGTVLGAALILTMGFAIFLLKKFQHKRPQAVATTDRALVSQMVSRTGELYGDDGANELNGRGHEVELDGVGI